MSRSLLPCKYECLASALFSFPSLFFFISSSLLSWDSKCLPLFAATTSSILISSSLTPALLFSVSKTWYRSPHLCKISWRSSPWFSMCCSMDLSFSESAPVKITIVCLQILSPKRPRCFSTLSRFSSVRGKLRLMTSRKTWGPGSHRNTLQTSSCFTTSGESCKPKLSHQHDVLIREIFLPLTSPSLFSDLTMYPSDSSSTPKMLFLTEALSDLCHPRMTTLSSVRKKVKLMYLGKNKKVQHKIILQTSNYPYVTLEHKTWSIFKAIDNNTLYGSKL